MTRQKEDKSAKQLAAEEMDKLNAEEEKVEEVEEEEVQSKAPSTKKGQYVCKTKCYWKLTIWKEGDTFENTKGEPVPRHFKFVG